MASHDIVPADSPLRRVLLALVLLTMVGLLTELFLLEHTESLAQWVPILGIAIGFVATLAVAWKPSRTGLRVFQGVMFALVVAGGVGVFLHLRGNLEFELEMDATMAGAELWWEVLRGATPIAAPGALAQLGLLGLAYTFRHPRLRG